MAQLERRSPEVPQTSNYSHYLPKVVVDHLHEKEVEAVQLKLDKVVLRPEFEQKVAVVLFADVSGFTSMAEKLAMYGDSEKAKLGTEALALELNNYMTQILRMVIASGGDVIKFAGDAMVCIFQSKFSVKEEKTDKAKAEHAILCNAAIQIAINMQNIPYINEYEFEKKFLPGRDVDRKAMILANNIQAFVGRAAEDNTAFSSRSIRLKVKFGIGLGRVNILYLGGASDNSTKSRFEYVAVGPALEYAYASEAHCKPGEVVVHRRVWKRVKEDKQAQNANIGRWNFIQTTRDLIRPSRPYHREKLDANHNTEFYKLDTQKNSKIKEIVKLVPQTYAQVNEETLMSYVPLAVIPYMRKHDRKIENWGNELRRVTTLFIQMGLTDSDMEKITNSENVSTSRLQNTFKMVQEDTYRYQGTVNKFLIDDKGSTLIVVFGLPPFAHDDDAVRGVLCAMAILETLQRQKLKGHVGISTGVSFCGVVGYRAGRREYSVIGNRINLAARLMGEAKSTWKERSNQNDIELEKLSLIIDRDTRLALNEDKLTQDFKKEDARLKGMETVHEVFRYEQKPKLVDIYSKSKGKKKYLAVVSATGLKTDEGDHGKELRKKSLQKTPNLIRKKKSSQAPRPIESNAEAHWTKMILIKDYNRWTIRDLKEQVKNQFRMPNLFENGNILLWESGGDPETSVLPPVLLDDSTPIASLKNNAEFLFFSLISGNADNKNVGAASTDTPAHIKSIKFEKQFPKLKLSEQEMNDTIQDTFSVISVLKKVKEERLKSVNKLKVVILEGSYGVGRTSAIKHVFSDKELRGKNIEVISASANRFLEKEEEACNVWKQVLNKLLYNRLHDSNVQPEKLIESALIAANKLFMEEELPSRMNESDRAYHRPESSSKSYLREILNFKHEKGQSNWPYNWDGSNLPLTCDKDDMKTILKKDKSFHGFVLSDEETKATILKTKKSESNTSLQNHESSRLQTKQSKGNGKNKSNISRRKSNINTANIKSIIRRPSNFVTSLIGKNKSNSMDALMADKKKVEKIVHLISGLVCGLVQINKKDNNKPKPLVITLDHTEDMDPFSWLVLVELAQWWSSANITIIMSLRNIMTHEDLRLEGQRVHKTTKTKAVDEAKQLINVFRNQHDKIIPFARHSIQGQFISRARTQRFHQSDEEDMDYDMVRPKTHGKISLSEIGIIESSHSKYPYLYRIEDRHVLINKLRTLTKNTRFIEVRSNVEHTEFLMKTLLAVEDVDRDLLKYFKRKSNGMPSIIKDGLRYFKEQKIIEVVPDNRAGHNILDIDYARFDEARDNVPQAVEAICGMILDTLSVTGQIALKVAAVLHKKKGKFSLDMVREVFNVQAISTELMQQQLPSDWELLIHSRTIVPVSGIAPRRPNSSHEYKFVFEWVRDSLQKRLLSGQAEIIENAIKTQIEKRELAKV